MAAPSPGETAAAAAAATTVPSSSSMPTQSPTSLTTSSSSAGSSVWTKEQDKQFENELNVHDQDMPKCWENIAAMVPGKDASEVKRHFEILQEDVSLIDAGRIALPNYTPSSSLLSSTSEEAAGLSETTPGSSKKAGASLYHHHHHGQPSGSAGTNANGSNGGGTGSSVLGKGVLSSKAADQERRKGIPWSEEEHRLFLLGLAKFGKGDWRSISRNFVISRTPTQVASHAQKYFIRLNSINKDKRRSSIHDITSVNNGSDAMQQGQQQGLITGQPALVPMPGQPVPQLGGVYGGQAPAVVGAPVMLPPPGHVLFGARGHLLRPPGMPGPPMPFPHMAYPMPQPSMHH